MTQEWIEPRNEIHLHCHGERLKRNCSFWLVRIRSVYTPSLNACCSMNAVHVLGHECMHTCSACDNDTLVCVHHSFHALLTWVCSFCFKSCARAQSCLLQLWKACVLLYPILHAWGGVGVECTYWVPVCCMLHWMSAFGEQYELFTTVNVDSGWLPWIVFTGYGVTTGQPIIACIGGWSDSYSASNLHNNKLVCMYLPYCIPYALSIHELIVSTSTAHQRIVH